MAGFVQPDNFIDVFWTGDINGQLTTRIIESSLQVIAVDKAFNEDQVSGRDAKTVTVAVTPEQVAKLTQAQATGELAMSLVGENAEPTTDAISIDTNDVLGIEETAPVVVAPKVENKICTRKERKGTEVIETSVPCDQ